MGESFEGDIDRARSEVANVSKKETEQVVQSKASNSQSMCVHIPARRACRSFLPCNISSSNFLLRSSSS